MNQFRKKPVVIQAVQLTMENMAEVMKWCNGTYWSRPPMRALTGITIKTLEGNMNASFGDWIICGVKGEFYPCKPEIFAETYEAADKKCTWFQEDQDGDHISTSCRNSFVLNDANDYEEGASVFPHCPFCTNPIVFRHWTPDDD